MSKHVDRRSTRTIRRKKERRRLRAFKSLLASVELRRREPALVNAIDEALEELSMGRTAKAENVVRQKLAQTTSNDPDARRRRAEYHRYLAAAVFVHSKTDALRELRAAVEASSDDAGSWSDLGEVYLAVGSLENGEHAFREALRLAHAQGRPEIEFRSLIGFGDALRKRGAGSPAEAAYRRANALAVQQVSRDASNTHWQRELAHSYESIGDVLKDKGEGDAALKAYGDGLATRRMLAERDASNVEWQRDLALSYESIGDVLKNKGDRDGALKSYNDGLAIRKKLTETDPSQIEWQRELAFSYDSIGRVLKDKGDYEGALTAQRHGLAIRKGLVERDASNMSWQRDLSLSYESTGDLLTDKGDLDAALKAHQEGLAIAKALVERDRSNMQWQRDLTFSYERIGDVMWSKGDRDGAFNAYQEGLSIRKKLVERDASNAEWQRDLEITYNRIGDILKDKGAAAELLGRIKTALPSQKLCWGVTHRISSGSVTSRSVTTESAASCETQETAMARSKRSRTALPFRGK